MFRRIKKISLKSCYEDMLQNKDDWLMKVKEELYKIGLGNIWEGNEIDNTSLIRNPGSAPGLDIIY